MSKYVDHLIPLWVVAFLLLFGQKWCYLVAGMLLFHEYTRLLDWFVPWYIRRKAAR